jgi:hypothetical protein
MKINKNVTVQPLFKNYSIKRQYIYWPIEDSEVVLVFERNNVGVKNLSSFLFEQTSDSFAFLNATCLSKYVLNCEQHFSYLDPH